jgi:hypothetical protein
MVCPTVDDTEQGAAATPTNNLCLRTAQAGDNIDGGDQCFCIVDVRVIGNCCCFTAS